MGYIYLIRHGRTQWNRDGVFRGQADIPLDDWGRRQGGAVAKALAGSGVEVIITSPLIRAVETATLATGYLPSCPIDEDKLLTDVDYGQWQGLSHGQVQELYPQLYNTWRTEPGAISFPAGESIAQVADRVWNAFQEFSTKYAKTTIALVSHRMVNKVLLAKALGAGLDVFWRIRQDTACINLLHVSDREVVVHKLNDTCHLQTLGALDHCDF